LVKLTPLTCKAARTLLEINQQRAAVKAGVGVAILANYEAGKTSPTLDTLLALQGALEASGVVFLGNDDGRYGVQLREPLTDLDRVEGPQ
jgi:transcriptional regulator with XRE-family HTH domain